jgi:TRAP-type uncharacterized transport system fused permease subunit
MYLMPFMFVYSPILMPNGFNAEVFYCWVILFLSVIPFAAGAMGYFFGHLNPVQRIVLIVSAVLFVFPSGIADLVGSALFLVVAVPQYLKWRTAGREQKALHRTPA